MATLDVAVRSFLRERRIAVAGVSRDPNQAGNHVFRKLRDTGHEVFAVNPAAEEVEGLPCYPDLASIPGGVDAVVAATPPEGTLDVVRQCVELGIPRVWMHRSFGRGSVSQRAVALGQSHGVIVIAGGCPLMFSEPVDPVHRCMRWILRVGGRLPREA